MPAESDAAVHTGTRSPRGPGCSIGLRYRRYLRTGRGTSGRPTPGPPRGQRGERHSDVDHHVTVRPGAADQHVSCALVLVSSKVATGTFVQWISAAASA